MRTIRYWFIGLHQGGGFGVKTKGLGLRVRKVECPRSGLSARSLGLTRQSLVTTRFTRTGGITGVSSGAEATTKGRAAVRQLRMESLGLRNWLKVINTPAAYNLSAASASSRVSAEDEWEGVNRVIRFSLGRSL